MSNKLMRSSDSELAAFLDKVRSLPAATGQGRLIFAMDATASRQPTWDQACHLQGEMFQAASRVGGLSVQLAWYRGMGEFETSDWFSDATSLVHRMTGVQCAGGLTQIGRVLDHAILESRKHRINALVLVGDCVEERPAELYRRGGQLGVLGIPLFVFHEGGEPGAAAVLRELCSISGGAYCRFDQGSAAQLQALLSAVAVYAAGGRAALENFSRQQSGNVKQLVHQLK